MVKTLSKKYIPFPARKTRLFLASEVFYNPDAQKYKEIEIHALIRDFEGNYHHLVVVKKKEQVFDLDVDIKGLVLMSISERNLYATTKEKFQKEIDFFNLQLLQDKVNEQKFNYYEKKKLGTIIHNGIEYVYVQKVFRIDKNYQRDEFNCFYKMAISKCGKEIEVQLEEDQKTIKQIIQTN